jgi:hypothetical protein
MTAFLVAVAVLSVVLLVLIIVAPWRKIRAEPPLDKADEAKLLLHRNPDEPTGEIPRVTGVPGPDDETDPSATYEDLGALDDIVDDDGR